MNEFFTWGTLGTYAGALMATTLVTQLFKGTGFIKKLPTRVFSYLVAFAILVLSRLFTGQLDWSSLALCAINAVVVSLASNGAYDSACKLNTFYKPKDLNACITDQKGSAKDLPINKEQALPADETQDSPSDKPTDE